MLGPGISSVTSMLQRRIEERHKPPLIFRRQGKLGVDVMNSFRHPHGNVGSSLSRKIRQLLRVTYAYARVSRTMHNEDRPAGVIPNRILRTVRQHVVAGYEPAHQDGARRKDGRVAVSSQFLAYDLPQVGKRGINKCGCDAGLLPEGHEGGAGAE
jgi:hypothetical protein